jgi:hypothetical protein
MLRAIFSSTRSICTAVQTCHAESRHVALTDPGQYSAGVRKLVLQRCALIALLLSRLVLGEVAHAMPMASHSSSSADMSLVENEPTPCPEHETGSPEQEAAQQVDRSVDASADGSEDHDCCKTGECQCACVHVPAAALDPIMVGILYVHRHRIPDGVHGLMLQQLSTLFRPPARFS